MKDYLFQTKPFYLNLLFQRGFLYLSIAIFNNLAVVPLHAKSISKATVKKKDHDQQATVVKTAPKQKLKPMVKPAKNKRSKANPFVREQIGELCRSTAQLGLSAGLVFGLHQFTNKPFDLSRFIAPIIGNLLTDPIKAIGTSCAMLFFPVLSKPKLNEAMALKKQYQARKQTFLPSMQSFIEHVLTYHIWAVQKFDYYSHKDVEVIKELLQFPVAPKKIVPDTRVIHEFMRNYPEEVRLAIGEFVSTIVDDYTMNQLTKKSTPIMFIGPPGTGKTYLAKQLAAFLKLPLESIDIANYRNIYGSSYRSSSPEKGVIAETLIGSPGQTENCSNKILVLDEIDKALAIDKDGKFLSDNGSTVYTFLHTLLEAQEVALPLRRYDNACADISQIKIILIANKTFTETLTPDKAAALESRVKTIRFDQGFTPDKKKIISAPYIDDLITKKGIDRALVNQDVLNEIIAEDVRLDLKGVRVLLSVIERYISSLKYQKLIHEISGIPITDFDVKKAYSPYQPQVNPLDQSSNKRVSKKH